MAITVYFIFRFALRTIDKRRALCKGKWAATQAYRKGTISLTVRGQSGFIYMILTALHTYIYSSFPSG